MSVAKVKTLIFAGMDCTEVEVQTYLSNGLPNITIVGLASKAIAEARERIKVAISSMGLSLPAKKFTVNLAPANVIKDGTQLDLPIALSILVAMNVLPLPAISNTICVGELSLDGEVTSVHGVLPACKYATLHGKTLICPFENSDEAQMINGAQIISATTLLNLVNVLVGKSKPIEPKPVEFRNFIPSLSYSKLEDIKRQSIAKRALVVAACGGHNILFSGHPGTGKSMLASAIMTILPPLDEDESLEVATIYSLSRQSFLRKAINERPFRSPHHSASLPSIVGGGKNASLGEITLAHNGVLFLDELAEFPSATLDSLRQPMESNQICVSRVSGNYTYPANFQLVAATNPCKCGYFGHPTKQCRKAPYCSKDYLDKISGPIMDRIDMHVTVNNIGVKFTHEEEEGFLTSESVVSLVKKVREKQASRYSGLRCKLNANLSPDLMERFCMPKDQVLIKLIEEYANKFNISMRGVSKILKVARTLADMDDYEEIQKAHILEAFSYRGGRS